MGDLIGEPALVRQRVVDALQKVVQGLSQFPELVAGDAEVEAAPGFVMTPVVGEGGHLMHDPQRAAHHEMCDTAGEEDREAAQDQDKVRLRCSDVS